jgi:hypothetical protein
MRIIRVFASFLILSLGLLSNLNAIGFEGCITFVKESVYDTTYMLCYVKGDMLRLEECNSKKKVVNVFLIDTQKETIVLVNPGKKLYSHLRQKPVRNYKPDSFIIQKTGLTKTINGEICQQWRVKSKESNSEMSYWVTQNEFFFFEKLARIFQNTETNWKFFSQIPNSQGFFPMVCVERNLVRDEKGRTRVMAINRKQINDNMFVVPSSYKPYIL